MKFFTLLIFLMLFCTPVVKAKTQWDLDVGQTAKYEFGHTGNTLKEFAQYYPHNDDMIYLTLIHTEDVNLQQWWSEAIQLTKSDTYSYQLEVDNAITNSSDLQIMIPFFFPSPYKVNTSEFSNTSVQSIVKHFDKEFVGEWGYQYKLTTNSSKYNIVVVFDKRYNAIASITITDYNSPSSHFTLIYAGEKSKFNLSWSESWPFYLLSFLFLLTMMVIIYYIKKNLP